MSESEHPVDYRTLLNLDFDPVEIREKYFQEREKRIRKDAGKQFIKVAGRMNGYLDDQFVSAARARPPVIQEDEVVVIGGGFGGLQVGGQLHKAGITDVRYIETAGDFGGTWYWYRYPGAACDTDSYTYLPFLEETGYMPTRMFIDCVEIQEHAIRIGRHFGFYGKALFETTVTGMEWDESAGRWRLETNRGDRITARFVVIAGGDAVKPKLPGIPGIETFKGHAFHTGRWDYSYTGGGPRSPMDQLAGKRVAIIGTGASAIQCIPRLGESARALYVFQRTPSGVGARNNSFTDPEWVAGLTPGWHERRRLNMVKLVVGLPADEDVSDNSFADMTRELSGYAVQLAERAKASGVTLSELECAELANMMYMEGLRKRCDDVVADPATAESLKPYYALWCKRPTWNEAFLQTFNRPNVTLVDTRGKGVERITETGVVANGKEYEVDLIVFGSGLEAGATSVYQIVRFPIRGRNGILLEDYWQDEFKTFLGVFVSNMPNYFQMTVIGAGLGTNFLHSNNDQARMIAKMIARCRAEDIGCIEATPEAEREWAKLIADSHDPTTGDIRAILRSRALADCTPGYLNAEGNPDDKKGLPNIILGSGPIAYGEILRDFVNDRDMKGLLVRAKTATAEA